MSSNKVFDKAINIFFHALQIQIKVCHYQVLKLKLILNGRMHHCRYSHAARWRRWSVLGEKEAKVLCS